MCLNVSKFVNLLFDMRNAIKTGLDLSARMVSVNLEFVANMLAKLRKQN